MNWTHQEIEQIVSEMSEFARKTRVGDKPSRHLEDFASEIGSIATSCEYIGYNPWPRFKEVYKDLDITIFPEFPRFAKEFPKAVNLFRKVELVGNATEMDVFRAFKLSRKISQFVKLIDGRLPKNQPPPGWSPKPVGKPKPFEPMPFQSPIYPLKTKEDLMNAGIELYNFYCLHAHDFSTSTNQFAGKFTRMGFSFSFIGLEDKPRYVIPNLEQTTEFNELLNLYNRLYTVFKLVEQNNQATEKQIFKAFVICRRIHSLCYDFGLKHAPSRKDTSHLN